MAAKVICNPKSQDVASHGAIAANAYLLVFMLSWLERVRECCVADGEAIALELSYERSMPELGKLTYEPCFRT